VRYLVQRDAQLEHEKQKFKLERYQSARKTYELLLAHVARLAALEAIKAPVSQEDVQRFLELYYGPMLELEDKEISETMDDIRTELLTDNKFMGESSRNNRLHELSRELRKRCDANLDEYKLDHWGAA